jgi:hypothetical protein
MARAIPLIVGSRIYAGANLPFYISKGMVTDWLEHRGFTGVQWHKRNEPLPFGLDAQKDPQYDDDWDVWAEAQYSGLESGQLEPPADPAWMRVELPATATSAIPPRATAAPGAATLLPPPSLSPPSPPAPQMGQIVTDPVVVRQRRLGVAVAVFGGFLAAGGLAWTMMSKRSPEPLPEPDEP